MAPRVTAFQVLPTCVYKVVSWGVFSVGMLASVKLPTVKLCAACRASYTLRVTGTPKMMVAKGSGLTTDPASVAGKIIGTIVSTTQEAYVQAKYPDSELKTYQTPDESYSDLAAGRIDAVVSDSLVGNEWLKTEVGMGCCESAGNVPNDPAILGKGAGFAIRQGDPLKDKLNAAIASTRADGFYDTLTAKYFTFDIYGE